MRFFLLLSLFLFATVPADACSYRPRPLDETLKDAQLSFIGTVVTVENRLAVIKAEKPIKGIKEGETIDVDITDSSCAIRFEAGQRWLYLGAEHPSGSVLLQDENGRVQTDNMKYVREKLADVPDDSPALVGGTIARSCAPWDGEAQMITLDNGVTATFYDSIAPLEKLDSKAAAAVFPADGKPERGHGQIVQCPQTKDGKPSDLPCMAAKGLIFMGEVNATEARGRVEIEEGEHHSRHVFKVKRVHKQVFCG